jgi:hypothetical protein
VATCNQQCAGLHCEIAEFNRYSVQLYSIFPSPLDRPAVKAQILKSDTSSRKKGRKRTQISVGKPSQATKGEENEIEVAHISPLDSGPLVALAFKVQ